MVVVFPRQSPPPALLVLWLTSPASAAALSAIWQHHVPALRLPATVAALPVIWPQHALDRSHQQPLHRHPSRPFVPPSTSSRSSDLLALGSLRSACHVLPHMHFRRHALPAPIHSSATPSPPSVPAHDLSATTPTSVPSVAEAVIVPPTAI